MDMCILVLFKVCTYINKSMYISYTLNKKEKDNPNYDLILEQRGILSNLHRDKREFERKIQLYQHRIIEIKKFTLPKLEKAVEFAEAELRILEKTKKK